MGSSSTTQTSGCASAITTKSLRRKRGSVGACSTGEGERLGGLIVVVMECLPGSTLGHEQSNLHRVPGELYENGMKSLNARDG